MSTMDPAHLHAVARSYQSDLITLLQEMVRIPSVNGRDNERAVAERLADEARRLGLVARLVADHSDRPNVIASWGDGPSGFALIGHLDTVAPGDDATWAFPPFGAILDGGRLYGRGAADNKAGLACGLYTLAMMRDLGLLNPHRHQLLLAGFVDEESGASSPHGVRYLLDRGDLPVQGAIYTYTSDIVCVGHRGLLRFELNARGHSVHTGSPAWSRGQEGVNAVTGLATILLALEELRLPFPEHPAFAGLNCTITPGTLFQGGEFASIVPAGASALVDVRMMPDQSSQEVLVAVEAIIASVVERRPGLKVELQVLNDLPGAAIPMDHPLAQIAAHQTELFTGRRWPTAGAGPANEGYMLIGAGIPTLCGFGPTGDNAHAADEWVDLDSLPQTMAIYAATIHDYLNLKGDPNDHSSS